MIYLTRPVWDIAINWAQSPAVRFDFDLRPIVLGQASPRHTATQQFVSRAWEYELLCETEARIRIVDDFTASVFGRLHGFWFPSPNSHGVVATKINNDSFDQPYSGLIDLWSEDAAVHVVFQPTSGSWYFGKITGVSDNRNGTERVTLQADAGRTLNAGDVWRQLLYVRLGDEVESAEFIADHVQRRRLRVVEIPTEYAEIEAGLRPVYLYEITTPNNAETLIYTRFTNLDVSIQSTLNGAGGPWLFTSFPIRHSALRRSLRSGPDDVTIESVHDPTNPISQYVPNQPTRPLAIKIYETTITAPNTVTAIFSGDVGETSADGAKLTSKCSPLGVRRGRKFPRCLIGPACNWTLFSAPCSVNKNSFKAVGTVTRVDGPFMTVTMADPPISDKPESKNEQYWALGYLEWTNPSHGIRGVSDSTVGYTITGGVKIMLTLDEDAPATLVGQQVTVFAGCDRSIVVCETKFSNLARFGGFPQVPSENPSVRAMQAQASNGNKK